MSNPNEQPTPIDNETILFENHLTREGLDRLAEHINQIFDVDLENSLTSFVPKGERPNWEAGISLAEIVSGTGAQYPEGENTKPFEVRIEIDGESMNARMVSQAVQQFVAYTELSRVTQREVDEQKLTPGDRETLLDFASGVAEDHFRAVTKKNQMSGTTLSNGQSARSALNASGMVFAQGIDKASPEQILKIISHIEQRSVQVTSVEGARDANNDTIRTSNILR